MKYFVEIEVELAEDATRDQIVEAVRNNLGIGEDDWMIHTDDGEIIT